MTIKQARPVYKNLLAGASLLTLGLAVGWWGRGFWVELRQVPSGAVADVTEAAVQLQVDWLDQFAASPSTFLAWLATEPSPYRIERMQAYIHRYGDQFVVLLSLSDLLSQQGRFEEALEMLLRSSLVAGAITEQDLFELNLARLIDDYSRELISLNQFDPLDNLYERLTLSLPQLAQYHLQLGLLRIRMGNLSAALVPLAQIANNDHLGAEARRLMTGIESNESTTSFSSGSSGAGSLDERGEELPLITASGQFLVEAMIDDAVAVTVLIDTGAAMTIFESAVLVDLGYNLNVRQELFITANGVVQAPVIKLESLSLGAARIENVVVGALELGLPGGVKGLLGMNFLKFYDFKIDQNRGVLILKQR